APFPQSATRRAHLSAHPGLVSLLDLVGDLLLDFDPRILCVLPVESLRLLRDVSRRHCVGHTNARYQRLSHCHHSVLQTCHGTSLASNHSLLRTWNVGHTLHTPCPCAIRLPTILTIPT